jgi:hypothetical protein
MLLWGPPSYFRTRPQSLKIRLILPYTTFNESKSDLIECISMDVHKDLLLQVYVTGLFAPLHYWVKSNRPYSKSTVATFFSRIKVCNLLEYSIILLPITSILKREPLGGGGVEVNPGQTSLITCAGKNKCYGFATKSSGTSQYILFAFTKVVHCIFLVPFPSNLSFVEFLLEDTGIHYIMTMRPTRLPQPVMIANCLDVDIYYSQFSCKTRVFVPSRATSLVAFESSCNRTGFSVHFEETDIIIDWYYPKSERVNGRVVSVIVKADRFSTIYITTEPVILGPKATFSMKMNIRDINISLMERYHRKFLLFSMHNVRAQYFANPNMQTINIFVHLVQLDDLHPLAVYHVAVIGQDRDNYHFLEFRCAFHQDMLTTKFD